MRCFYTTTPPSVYLAMLRTGELTLGNLTLRVRPNVVIGPRDVVERLHAEGETGASVAFARSRGNVYLVRRGESEGDSGGGGSAAAGCGAVHVESRDRGGELRGCTGRQCSRRRGIGGLTLGRWSVGSRGRAGVRPHRVRGSASTIARRRRRWRTGRWTWRWCITTLRCGTCGCFRGSSRSCARGWDPEGDGGGEPAQGMVVTEYAVAPARWVGEWGGGICGVHGVGGGGGDL